jgi:hypothetical protein
MGGRNSAVKETKMPAVSIALIRDGQLAWRRAFGVKDTSTNEPVDLDSVFAACSDTKPVFAYGVVKLSEYYCFTAGSTERRSGLMVMLNGDTYVPFLLKMLANPSGPPPKVETVWPDFAKRFFAA